MGMPDWALEIPSAPVHQEQPNQLVRPFTAQQLIEFGQELIEQFLRRVVLAVVGSFIPGEASFDQLRDWALNLPVIGDILTKINDTFSAIFGGIDFTGTLPTPGEVWQTVIDTLMLPLNLLLGPNSPLNPANILGRLRINQIGGVSLSHVITQTSNLFAEFLSADSVPDADGWSFDAVNSAAQVVLDGTTKAIYDDPIDVAPGQEIAGSIEALLESVTSDPGAAVELALLLYDGVSESPTGTHVLDSIVDPSGTVSWAALSGTYTVPASGVKAVAPELRVEGGTAGTVKFKTPAGEVVLPDVLQDGLPKAIQDRIDDLQATWDAFKGAAGGTVSDIQDALDDAGQAIRDALANALGHGGTGHTSANLLTYFQSIPQSVVNGLTGSLGDLQTTLNQIGDIFEDNVVTPINSIVQAVKDWWNTWFGGGSDNAIPLSQKGAVNGVAPLDGNRKVPSIYLPATGGGEENVPTDHILFTLPADQSIPSGVATALTGWEQTGSLSATFDDGTNTRFELPKSGWWDLQSQVVWGSSATGKRQSAVVRTLSSGSVIPAISGEDAADFPAWGVRNKIRDVQEVGARGTLAATDLFSVEAYQNSGGALNAVAGYPHGTYLLAVYLGQEEEEFNPNTEENEAVTNAAVPSGAAGCWVTLGGAGGGGGGSQASGNQNRKGGAGGGSGAFIARVWIPLSALGTTYTVVVGAKGTGGAGGTTAGGAASAGTNGSASQFISGSITLTAGGGLKGGGGSSSGVGVGGAGGTATATGFTATLVNGNAGENGNQTTNGSTPPPALGGARPTGHPTGRGGAGGQSLIAGVAGEDGYTLIEWE